MQQFQNIESMPVHSKPLRASTLEFSLFACVKNNLNISAVDGENAHFIKCIAVN